MGEERLECTKVPLKTWASGGRCGEPMAAAGGLAAASGARSAATQAAERCHPTSCRPSVSPRAGGGFLELSPFLHPLVTFSSRSGFYHGRATPFPDATVCSRCPRRPGRECGSRCAPVSQTLSLPYSLNPPYPRRHGPSAVKEASKAAPKGFEDPVNCLGSDE